MTIGLFVSSGSLSLAIFNDLFSIDFARLVY